MKITAQMLRDKNACQPSIDRFIELHGEEGVEVTLEGCLARAAEWDWSWSAKAWLNGKQYAKWEAERATIDAKCDSERDTINAKCDAERDTINAKWSAELARLFWECLNYEVEV